jgi:ABC-type glycerol-3-phosphate transport system substrate-binding protein
MLPVFVPSTQWGVNNLVMYLQSRNINIYNADGTVIPNNAKAAETLQWYYDLKAKHGIAMPIKFFEPEFWAAFNADQIATWPMNPAEASDLISEVKSKAGKWGIMAWPLWSANGPKTTGVWGGAVFTAPASTSHPAEATTFIEFISTNPEGALANWESASDWPAYMPNQQLIRSREPWFKEYFQDSLIKAIEARTPPTFYRYNWAKTEMIVGAAIDSVYSGKTSAADAWKQVERELSRP